MLFNSRLLTWNGAINTVNVALLSLVIAFAIALACPLTIYGQNTETEDESRLAFSVALGGNFVSVDYDQPLAEWDPGRRVSYHASVSALYDVFRPLTLESGLRLVQLGNEVQVDYAEVPGRPSGDGSFQIRQWYLAVPLLAHVNLPLLQSQQISVFAGPEVGYLLKGQAVMRFNDPVAAELANEPINITDSLERFNVAVRVGMQYQFPIRSRDFFLRGSYGFGVVDTATTPGWLTAWQTREIAIGAGILF